MYTLLLGVVVIMTFLAGYLGFIGGFSLYAGLPLTGIILILALAFAFLILTIIVTLFIVHSLVKAGKDSMLKSSLVSVLHMLVSIPGRLPANTKGRTSETDEPEDHLVSLIGGLAGPALLLIVVIIIFFLTSSKSEVAAVAAVRPLSVAMMALAPITLIICLLVAGLARFTGIWVKKLRLLYELQRPSRGDPEVRLLNSKASPLVASLGVALLMLSLAVAAERLVSEGAHHDGGPQNPYLYLLGRLVKLAATVLTLTSLLAAAYLFINFAAVARIGTLEELAENASKKGALPFLRIMEPRIERAAFIGIGAGSAALALLAVWGPFSGSLWGNGEIAFGASASLLLILLLLILPIAIDISLGRGHSISLQGDLDVAYTILYYTSLVTIIIIPHSSLILATLVASATINLITLLKIIIISAASIISARLLATALRDGLWYLLTCYWGLITKIINPK